MGAACLAAMNSTDFDPSQHDPAFGDEAWLQVTQDQLNPAHHVPTMLSPFECQLYYWLTRNGIGGAGAVVDLGCYVGGSTARLALGAADAGSDARIHAYDRFVFSRRSKAQLSQDLGVAPPQGMDMLPMAQDLLTPWAGQIDWHKGDITELGYDPAIGPIAILVLDACKTPESSDVIIQQFLPHLKAGESIVCQQDYLQWNQFWLPAMMLLLEDFLQPVAFVPPTSMIYRCIRVPTAEELQALTVTDLPDEVLIEAIQETRRRLTRWDMDARLRHMIQTIRLNPGIRRHWRMRRPNPPRRSGMRRADPQG